MKLIFDIFLSVSQTSQPIKRVILQHVTTLTTPPSDYFSLFLLINLINLMKLDKLDKLET